MATNFICSFLNYPLTINYSSMGDCILQNLRVGVKGQSFHIYLKTSRRIFIYASYNKVVFV